MIVTISELDLNLLIFKKKFPSQHSTPTLGDTLLDWDKAEQEVQANSGSSLLLKSHLSLYHKS